MTKLLHLLYSFNWKENVPTDWDHDFDFMLLEGNCNGLFLLNVKHERHIYSSFCQTITPHTLIPIVSSCSIVSLAWIVIFNGPNPVSVNHYNKNKLAGTHLPERFVGLQKVCKQTIIYYNLLFGKPEAETGSFYLPFTFIIYQNRSVSYLLRFSVLIYIILQLVKKLIKLCSMHIVHQGMGLGEIPTSEFNSIHIFWAKVLCLLAQFPSFKLSEENTLHKMKSICQTLTTKEF